MMNGRQSVFFQRPQAAYEISHIGVIIILQRFHPLARAAVGYIAVAILGNVASAIVGYLLYFVMLLSVLNRPGGIDSWFAAMAALPWLGWTFGALPGALSGAATLASQRLIAVLTGCLASLAYAFVGANRGTPASAA
jgi:hypothetical protein